VSKALKEKGDIPLYPAPPVPLPNLGPHHDHTYSVVKVRGLTGKSSPFEVVKATRGSEMERQGIAVIATDNPGEFYVLNTSEKDGGGHAEELLDQRCR
jgi:CDP-diacylglycerol pyrophosphatase